MNIKQKRNLIYELSFCILQEIEEVNNSEKTTEEKKININQLINIVKYNKSSSNKHIKVLINEFTN